MTKCKLLGFCVDVNYPFCAFDLVRQCFVV